ncbi:MAG: hypothetical protein ACFFCW_11560 [Candidatus Hodarchaeota archaeon]
MFSSVVVCARFLISNPDNVPRHLKDSDLVIGAVLIPGSVAPALVTKEMISAMAPGSVVVDVAIDQGKGDALRRASPPLIRIRLL